MKNVTPIQRQITDRLFESMYYLISIGKIRTKTEFSEGIKFTYPHLIRLEKVDHLSISLDSIYYASINFGISLEFLIKGQGRILESSSKKNLNQNLNQKRLNLDKMNELTKSQITDLQQYN
jgi:hypothetical protein